MWERRRKQRQRASSSTADMQLLTDHSSESLGIAGTRMICRLARSLSRQLISPLLFRGWGSTPSSPSDSHRPGGRRSVRRRCLSYACQKIFASLKPWPLRGDPAPYIPGNVPPEHGRIIVWCHLLPLNLHRLSQVNATFVFFCSMEFLKSPLRLSSFLP
jgi:hypothetical protein